MIIASIGRRRYIYSVAGCLPGAAASRPHEEKKGSIIQCNTSHRTGREAKIQILASGLCAFPSVFGTFGLHDLLYYHRRRRRRRHQNDPFIRGGTRISHLPVLDSQS